jgi:hypothetical protein
LKQILLLSFSLGDYINERGVSGEVMEIDGGNLRGGLEVRSRREIIGTVLVGLLGFLEIPENLELLLAVAWGGGGGDGETGQFEIAE